MPLVERMTVAGVGLIGGSLAAAARDAGLVGEVVGFGRSAANLAIAMERGLIDRIAADDAEAADADLIILAAPVQTCAVLAERFARHARPTTVLTDVGSVKASLVAALEGTWRDPARVVGTHPIAGSEASGAGAARADLFRDRLCVLTPTAQTGKGALELVRALWEGVGARVEFMKPETHDAILARVSHLPHVLAYALMLVGVGPTREGRRLLDYAGTGFLDTTRIAASPAEVWRDIALANRTSLIEAINEFRMWLDVLVQLIETEDGRKLKGLFDDAATVRRGLGGKA